jgi:hypothetical protein
VTDVSGRITGEAASFRPRQKVLMQEDGQSGPASVLFRHPRDRARRARRPSAMAARAAQARVLVAEHDAVAVAHPAVHPEMVIGGQRVGTRMARRALVTDRATLLGRRGVAAAAVPVRRRAEARAMAAGPGVLMALGAGVARVAGAAARTVQGGDEAVTAETEAVVVIAGCLTLVAGLAARRLVVAQRAAVDAARRRVAEDLAVAAAEAGVVSRRRCRADRRRSPPACLPRSRPGASPRRAPVRRARRDHRRA